MKMTRNPCKTFYIQFLYKSKAWLEPYEIVKNADYSFLHSYLISEDIANRPNLLQTDKA